MKSYGVLFKKYRLRAEFETFSAFGDALAEKGYYYEDSIFSHWQKGNRTPTNRQLIIKVIEIFIEKKAIESKDEADEFLSSTGLGYLTEDERQSLGIQLIKASHKHKTKKDWMRNLLLICIFALGAVLVYSFIENSFEKNYIDASPTVPSAVTEPKKLVVGIDGTLEPMEYIENDKLVGFDVDLATQLAKEMDADIEFKNISFDNIFNSLDARKINMIISAVTIIDERKQKYDFSNPYLNAGQVIITKKDNTEIHSITDLQGKRIATQTGTTNEKEASKYTSDKLVIRYPDFVQATKALVEGNVDALFTDLPNAKGITSKNPSLQIVSEPFTQEYYGIVFLKGDPSVTQVNEALKSLEKKDVLEKLENKWLE